MEDAGLFAAAHKCLLFDTGISWERIGEYAPPANGGSVDAIFTGLKVVDVFSWLAEVVEPLRVLLEEHMGEFNAGPNELRRIERLWRKHGRASR